MAGGLLSAYAKLFTSFLHYRGFTLGVEDILVQSAVSEFFTFINILSSYCLRL